MYILVLLKNRQIAYVKMNSSKILFNSPLRATLFRLYLAILTVFFHFSYWLLNLYFVKKYVYNSEQWLNNFIFLTTTFKFTCRKLTLCVTYWWTKMRTGANQHCSHPKRSTGVIANSRREPMEWSAIIQPVNTEDKGFCLAFWRHLID